MSDHGVARKHRLFWLAAAVLFIAAMGTIETGLRLLSWIPPESPVLMQSRVELTEYSPFVETTDGTLTIRPDWEAPGDTLRAVFCDRPGEALIFPSFRPVSLQIPKPEEVTRVFVLGGSGAFGLYVSPQDAFPHLLEERLEDIYPGGTSEVINLGSPGWASDNVLALLERVLEWEPDLIVVYSGHNEMLCKPDGREAPLRMAWKFRIFLTEQSITYRWFEHAVTSTWYAEEVELNGEIVRARAAGTIPVYDSKNVPARHRCIPESKVLSEAAGVYGRNIRSMASKCREAGVSSLFVMPVANLFTPPQGIAAADISGKARELTGTLEKARSSFNRGKMEEAFDLLLHAEDIASPDPGIQYKIGTVLMKMGRREESLERLRRARDLDPRTHRISSLFEEAFIESVNREGAASIDPRAVFYSEMHAGKGGDLFIDHCHFNARCHQMIADALFPKTVALLGGPHRHK